VIGVGFAAVTFLVVISTFAGPILYRQYKRSLLHTRETVLRQDLFVMREAIDQFTTDKSSAPQSLDDLRRAGYLQEIPRDPFTHSANWTTETCDSLKYLNQRRTGICDVHSVAPGRSPFEGTPYKTW
jgi:general secretion pathway protein G